MQMINQNLNLKYNFSDGLPSKSFVKKTGIFLMMPDYKTQWGGESLGSPRPPNNAITTRTVAGAVPCPQSGRFYHQAAAHLEMKCMTEVGTVAPKYPGLVSNECDRLGFMGADHEVDIIFGDGKTMPKIFDFIMVGQDNGNLVSLFYPELRHAVCRRH